MQPLILLCCSLLLSTVLGCQTSPAPPPAAPVMADSLPPPADSTALDTMAVEGGVTEIRPDANVSSPSAGAGMGVPGGTGGVQTPPTAQRPAEPEEFTDVTALDPTIRLDIKYATRNNFTKKQIYDCPRCLLRPEVARAVVKAHQALRAKGYGLKMFDCYRPRPYQQRLWDAVPNPDYVTPPAKGSMHSRGAAVDLTVVDAQGNELDMGTPYDFFGREAHTDNRQLPPKVLANRKLLADALRAAGFEGIRTEWWHFSFRGKKYPLANYVWPCK